jgi:hypothetical protein
MVIDKKKNLETCLVIATGFSVIYIFKNWQPLLIGAVVVGLTGIFLDKPASWITWLWMKIADLLGQIMPKIILSLVFFVFLVPVSLFSRIFRGGKDKKPGDIQKSMWINRDYSYSGSDLNKPW